MRSLQETGEHIHEKCGRVVDSRICSMMCRMVCELANENISLQISSWGVGHPAFTRCGVIRWDNTYRGCPAGTRRAHVPHGRVQKTRLVNMEFWIWGTKSLGGGDVDVLNKFEECWANSLTLDFCLSLSVVTSICRFLPESVQTQPRNVPIPLLWRLSMANLRGR